MRNQLLQHEEQRILPDKKRVKNEKPVNEGFFMLTHIMIYFDCCHLIIPNNQYLQ